MDNKARLSYFYCLEFNDLINPRLVMRGLPRTNIVALLMKCKSPTTRVTDCPFSATAKLLALDANQFKSMERMYVVYMMVVYERNYMQYTLTVLDHPKLIHDTGRIWHDIKIYNALRNVQGDLSSVLPISLLCLKSVLFTSSETCQPETTLPEYILLQGGNRPPRSRSYSLLPV